MIGPVFGHSVCATFLISGLDGEEEGGGGSVSCSGGPVSILCFIQLSPTESVVCSVLEIHQNIPECKQFHVFKDQHLAPCRRR